MGSISYEIVSGLLYEIVSGLSYEIRKWAVSRVLGLFWPFIYLDVFTIS